MALTRITGTVGDSNTHITGSAVSSSATSISKVFSGGVMSGSAQTAANLPTGTVSASMGVSGSSTSTGSFGKLLGEGGDITGLTAPAITSIAGAAANQILTDDGDATVTSEANLTFDGTNLDMPDSIYARFGTGNDLQLYHDGSNSFIQQSGTGALKLATEDSGKAVSIGHTTSETTVNDNLTVTGDLVVTSDIQTSTSGTSNLCLGVNAGGGITAGGNYNVFLGDEAGTASSTGDNNTLVGYNAGTALNHVNSGHNTFIGATAGEAAGNGVQCDSNVVIGSAAGTGLTTGGNNTIIGCATGQTLTTGIKNTIVGKGCNVPATDSTKQMIFGRSIAGSGDNTFTFGDGSNDTTCDNGGTSWSNPSDIRIKKNVADDVLGLAFLNDIKPRTFDYKALGELEETHKEYVSGSTEPLRKSERQHGFIAQEVKEAIDKHSDDVQDGFEGWRVNATNDYQRVAPSAFIPMLIKAVQELSAKVEALENA